MFLPVVDDDDSMMFINDSSSGSNRELKNRIITPCSSSASMFDTSISSCNSSISDICMDHSIKDHSTMNHSPNHDQQQLQHHNKQQQHHTIVVTYRSTTNGHAINYYSHNSNDCFRQCFNIELFDNLVRKRFFWYTIALFFMGSCQVRHKDINQVKFSETKSSNHNNLRGLTDPMLTTSFSLNTTTSSENIIVSESNQKMNDKKDLLLLRNDMGSNTAPLLTSLSKLTRGNTKNIDPDVLWSMTKPFPNNNNNNNKNNNNTNNNNNNIIHNVIIKKNSQSDDVGINNNTDLLSLKDNTKQ